VPTRNSFDYAVLRVVPRVERGEFVNAGVIVFCLEKKYLGARVHVEEERLRALWPEVDLDLVRNHLEAFQRICNGDEAAGPVAKLAIRERFHWLVSPRSTMIQVSPVHSGLCEGTDGIVDRLFQELVLTP
jgi:hypothetical protein